MGKRITELQKAMIRAYYKGREDDVTDLMIQSVFYDAFGFEISRSTAYRLALELKPNRITPQQEEKVFLVLHEKRYRTVMDGEVDSAAFEALGKRLESADISRMKQAYPAWRRLQIEREKLAKS